MFWRTRKPETHEPIEYWVICGYVKNDHLRTYFISTQKDHGACHECVDGPFSRTAVSDALDYWRAIHKRRPESESAVLEAIGAA